MENSGVTAVIITKNEEKQIDECLKSVSWVDEIIVVDDESTDNTLEIVKKYTDKIYTRKMDNEGRHRNYANSLATKEWILSIDADERITPELALEIQEVAKTKDIPHVCYAMPMKTFIGDEWIQGAGYYPAYRTKIFRNGKLKYKEEAVHPPVKYEGSCGRHKGDILHYTSPSLERWIQKFNRETSLEADKWIRKSVKPNALKVLRKAISRFLKFYFQKGGIKHGFSGFLMAQFHSLYQIISYAKYKELKRKKKIHE